MTEEHQHDIDVGRPRDRIDILLDGAAEPLLSTTPPLSFELDTSLMEDGPHTMRIEAYDDLGVRGTRTIDFSVRNGPGATRPRSCGSQTSLDCANTNESHPTMDSSIHPPLVKSDAREPADRSE